MSRIVERASGLAAAVIDGAKATMLTAWPHSEQRREVARLTEEGFAAGEPCEFDFVVSFDESAANTAIQDVRAAGFAASDVTRTAQGFLTVRANVELRALALSWTHARIDRIARRHGGFAEMLGAVRPVTKVGALRAPAGAQGALSSP